MKQTEKPAVKEGVRELIYEYFKVDVLEEEPLTKDTRQNIIATFTFAYNRHLSIQAISRELQQSNLSELKDRIIKRMASNYNPYPIRLGNLKPILQQEAFDNNKSLHSYLLSIFREREDRNKRYLDLYCVRRLNRMYRYNKPFKNLMVCQLSLPLNLAML